MTTVHDAELDALRRQFLDPDDEYSPVPFWFWNDLLQEEELVRQIREFKSKGVAGFVIHPRLGYSETIPYMSDAYMDKVETAVEEAERQGMKVFLYDEAMYPSGSAMGRVVGENPDYASRGLRMEEFPCNGAGMFPVMLKDGEALVSAQAVEKLSPTTVNLDRVVLLEADLERGQVCFIPPVEGEWSVLLFVETFSKGTIRGLYFGQDDLEPGAPPSADLLNPKATETFIRLTHEIYYKRLKRHFGHTVQAMFTDEPNILGRCPLPGLHPWTGGFLEYVGSLGLKEKDISALWFDAGEQTETVRDSYEKAVNRKLAASFYRPLSVWCEERGIQLTGHPGLSDEIGMLDYFHLPGQDIVWRMVEPGAGKGITGADSTLGKCSSDAARHRGRRRNMNECFGACFQGGIGWHFTADDMKWYMDWLFVRGVNMLVPHAFYYSLEGRRKDERPPDVGLNSIWWPHYRTISAYMRRMSWLMTDSVNAAKIAVLCEESRLPWEMAVPLYENQREFNYLEERLFLLDSTIGEDGTVRIAEQKYFVIAVDRPERFEEETRRKLLEFERAGGTVIVWRHESAACGSWAALDERAEAESASSGSAAVWERRIPPDVRLEPAAPFIRVSHVRKGGVHFYLFVNEGELGYDGAVRLETSGSLERWDPWEGTAAVQPVGQMLRDGGVLVPLALDRRQSVIYCVNPSGSPAVAVAPKSRPVVKAVPILEGWTVQKQSAVPSRLEPAGLESWTEWDGMAHYSGTVEYAGEFHLDPVDADAHTIRLDLGDVREMAEVRLNGVDLGVRMWQPYLYADITEAIRPGTNRLCIRVTNSLANAYNRVSLPSGLLGPVCVEVTAKP
ncbi:glycosylhydrolase-like jelly roll fold domain-containing protein [Paenibacillus sp. MBLB4367]|uniref:glycosylhydrolase-like jelly roll fold domain-containing protein n=1 Tax=Paenibacillus sp. MBLB4367 TaxID=3384767 RepID=UPI003908002E